MPPLKKREHTGQMVKLLNLAPLLQLDTKVASFFDSQDGCLASILLVRQKTYISINLDFHVIKGQRLPREATSRQDNPFGFSGHVTKGQSQMLNYWLIDCLDVKVT